MSTVSFRVLFFWTLLLFSVCYLLPARRSGDAHTNKFIERPPKSKMLKRRMNFKFGRNLSIGRTNLAARVFAMGNFGIAGLALCTQLQVSEKSGSSRGSFAIFNLQFAYLNIGCEKAFRTETSSSVYLHGVAVSSGEQSSESRCTVRLWAANGPSERTIWAAISESMRFRTCDFTVITLI